MNRPTFLRRSTALLLTLVLMVCAALPGFAAYQTVSYTHLAAFAFFVR